jgi:PIN domain nuclease of toxin-antitoxin system
LWWVLGDERLSGRAREVIGTSTTTVHVSAITALEIAIKVRLLKLSQAYVLVHRFEDEVERQGFNAISVTPGHARCAGLLKGAHRDPFDRVLAAQALIEGLVLVSNDDAIDALGAQRIW